MSFQNSVYGSRRRVSAVPKTKTFLVEIPNDQGVPASEDVAILQDRIGLLEALLNQHGITVPPFVEASEIPEVVTIPVIGYCKSGLTPGERACPTVVSMEADAAFEVWTGTVFPEATDKDREKWQEHVQKCFEAGTDPGESPFRPDGTVYRPSLAAAMTLHRDLLVAVMPGLSPEVASVLAGQGGDSRVILSDLGWLTAPVEADEIADPNETGEAASPSTGESSSPPSVPSIPGSTS